MVDVVTANNRRNFRPVLDGMHRDRKQVFVDQLKWDIPVVDGQFEKDQFDNDDAIYLVATDPQRTRHLASVRLLPSTGPHLLGDVFPYLCEGEVPRGDDVWEITRLCSSPARDFDVKLVRRRLATAMVEFALLYGIQRYTCITHVPYLSYLLAVGWECEPLGMPQTVGDSLIGALSINITPATLQLFRQKMKSRVPVLQLDHIAHAA